MTDLMKQFLSHIDHESHLSHQEISNYAGTADGVDSGDLTAPVGCSPEYASRIYLVAVMWEAGLVLRSDCDNMASEIAFESYQDACTFAADMGAA